MVQRPRDLTRAQLRELRLELDKLGYSEANLRRAWYDAKNEDIAASIIGFVRQAALGDPLIPFADRVRAAMNRIYASRAWTDPQRRWLKRIAEQAEREIVVDREALDRPPFDEHGGFARLNRGIRREARGALSATSTKSFGEKRREQRNNHNRRHRPETLVALPHSAR